LRVAIIKRQGEIVVCSADFHQVLVIVGDLVGPHPAGDGPNCAWRRPKSLALTTAAGQEMEVVGAIPKG